MTGLRETGELNDLPVAGALPPAASYRPPGGRTGRVSGFRILNAVSKWALLGLVVAAAFEVTARVEDWIMYRTPFDSPYGSIDDLRVRDADGMHGRPNARFQRWIMNSLGTRGPETSVVPAPGTSRVITVGASETFGMRESSDKEYPRQLEDSLNARVRREGCANSQHRQFEVLNAAFAGMSLPTIIQDVRIRLVRLRPSVVTAYPSPVSYLYDLPPRAAQPDSTGPQQVPGFREAWRPRGRDRLREQLKMMLPEAVKTELRQREIDALVDRHEPGWRFTSVPQERLAAFELDLRRLVGAIRSIGAVPVLVTHAMIFHGRSDVDPDMMTAELKFAPRATASTLIQFDSLARIVTLRVAADSGVVVVDAASRLAGAPISAFADAVHFTDFGAAIVAGKLTDGVLAAQPPSLQCAAQ